MPIVAKVGRRSVKGRCLILFIYTSLILGAITTVYPFWLMLAGAAASNDTTAEFRLIPRYLYSERALYEAHLYSKYYRYAGPSDIEQQWKVNIPASYGRNSAWSQVPGERPGPDAPESQALLVHFCVDPFEAFQIRYTSIGSPGRWNASLKQVVMDHYPFAVDAVRKLVERSSPFKLERYTFVKTLEAAFLEYFGRFAADYDAAGRPRVGSSDYERVINRYPDLSRSQQFAAIMRIYMLCRKPDLADPHIRQRIEDYNAFRATLPVALRDAYWIGSSSRLFEGDDLYQNWVRNKYVTLESLNSAYKSSNASWGQVYAPSDFLDRRNRYFEDTAINQDWCAWKTQIPARYVRPAAIEYWWNQFLEHRYNRQISKLNEAYGTSYLRFFDIGLDEHVPSDEPRRTDWEQFVRTRLPPRYMRYEGGDDLWRDDLISKFGSLDRINTTLNRHWAGLDQIRLPDTQSQAIGAPPTKRELDLLLEFVANELPMEYVSVRTPENIYRDMLLEKYGSMEAVNQAHGLHAATLSDVYFPMPEVDWSETVQNAGHIRWFTLTRAYKVAFNHIVRYKRSLWNTFVFCASTVLAALVINPLCAYALSRFNLAGAYKIMLFLLATMAFPAEVTMIPNFLLLKSFPAMQIVCCLVGTVIGGALMSALIGSKGIAHMLAGALAGGVIGATVVAWALTDLFQVEASVSLLNTYWALILPGVASGYSIFILKGFFDSLPAELYESAVIDGAGELRIFAQITLPMSTPVLAVIGLWAFTAAYGSFTWALIICQDDSMWTLMVHLYQYQMVADPCEQLAALVLASVPTLIVFLFAQKVILKGIVLPTYK